MKIITPIAIALWCWLAEVLMPPVLVVPLALLGARWDPVETLDSNGTTPYRRGDLPHWARWFSTPDERLPGGTYEPAVLRVLEGRGRFLCAWYWLGMRNRLQGLGWAYRRRMGHPWNLGTGYQSQGDLWWLRWPIPGTPWHLKAGWRQYVHDGWPWAVPCLTVTKP